MKCEQVGMCLNFFHWATDGSTQTRTVQEAGFEEK